MTKNTKIDSTLVRIPGGSSVGEVAFVKFLGVTVDCRKLTWETQVAAVRNHLNSMAFLFS